MDPRQDAHVGFTTPSFVEGEMAPTLTLGQIASHWGWGLQGGNPDQVVRGVNSLQRATAEEVSFLDNPKYRAQLPHTRAAAVLLKPDFAKNCPVPALITPRPYLAFAQLAGFWGDGKHGVGAPSGLLQPGIHPSAVVHPTAQIHPTALIGPQVVIESGVVIGAETVVGAGCVIGACCVIGDRVWFHPRVTLYPKVRVGSGTRIHSGAVLGSDGFGFAQDGTRWLKIPQKGGVHIGTDVEIGANTTIDCGTLEDTWIGDGVKLDNQIQVAHNVRIGDHTAIAGCVGIAGGTQIGAHCLIGGGTGIAGHLRIADRVVLAGMSMVTQSIEKSGTYASGTGLMPIAQWRKAVVGFRHLDDWRRRVTHLEKQTDNKS